LVDRGVPQPPVQGGQAAGQAGPRLTRGRRQALRAAAQLVALPDGVVFNQPLQFVGQVETGGARVGWDGPVG
jgi:hypothetical protein